MVFLLSSVVDYGGKIKLNLIRLIELRQWSSISYTSAYIHVSFNIFIMRNDFSYIRKRFFNLSTEE
jgi:hypothetical protein